MTHDPATDPPGANQPAAGDALEASPSGVVTDPSGAVDRAVALARELFLDEGHEHGCAETAYLALARAYDLEGVTSSAPAMALNGGIAYSGGPCGAITGAAMAVGLLAESRISDHRTAKRIARELVAGLMDDFAREHGTLDCRDLIGLDLRAPGAHDAFLASGLWRDRCMHQIEFSIRGLAVLADPSTWRRAVEEIEAAGE